MSYNVIYEMFFVLLYLRLLIRSCFFICLDSQIKTLPLIKECILHYTTHYIQKHTYWLMCV